MHKLINLAPISNKERLALHSVRLVRNRLAHPDFGAAATEEEIEQAQRSLQRLLPKLRRAIGEHNTPEGRARLQQENEQEQKIQYQIR